jgi:hypothetical protein
MPIFDPTTSRRDRAGRAVLRSVLGPAKPRRSDLRTLATAYRRSRRRRMLARAFVVLVFISAALAPALVGRVSTPEATLPVAAGLGQ